MRVIYATSIPTLPRIDFSSTHVGFQWLFDREGYIPALREKQNRGNRIVQISEYNTVQTFPDVISATAYPVEGANGVIVRNRVEYERAAKNKYVSIIAILPTSTSEDRIALLRDLVFESHSFTGDKETWLYGLPNPAELGVYTAMFSEYVLSRLTVVCASCFLYSLYGVLFSREHGVLRAIPGCEDNTIDLHMNPVIESQLSTEQFRAMLHNREIVDEFSNGLGKSSPYVDRLLSEHDVEVSL